MSRNLLKYKKNTLVFIFGMAFFLMNPQAFADSEGIPTSFTEVTKDKKYVFAMISPWDRSWGESTLKYKQAGLYKNNGALVPDWTVDWYSSVVTPNSDGKHLIRYGPWASHPSQEALSFFKKGKLTKYYRIDDLVKDLSKLEYTVSHFFWQKESHYFEKEGAIYLKTLDRNTYVFSIYTGKILPSESSKYLEIIEKVKQQKKEAKRKKRIASENVDLDEGAKLITEYILSRLPTKFSIEDAKKQFDPMVEAHEYTKSIIWEKVLLLITSSNQVIEKTIDGKKYYQKK